jgi:hypothetical protein
MNSAICGRQYARDSLCRFSGDRNTTTSTLSRTLIVCLVTSAFPGTAQTQGVLARAATREAVRLTAVQVSETPTESGWSSVVAIASGTNVVVTVRGAKPTRCTFVQADESSLIVRTGRWQVVQMIARNDVQEIRTGSSGKRRALGLLVGAGGAIGGTVVGGTIGSLGSDAENVRGFALGAMAGLVGGAVLGYHAVTHTKGNLIYRAP